MSRIRITGGAWRSRLIEVAPLPGLRPTPDRVRQTLFNWLGQRLEGLRCLDLFAGTGVLGFEAASRGAAEVVLVEQNARAAAALRDMAARLPAPGVRVVQADAARFLAQAPGVFDVIFLDPPYRAGWLEKLAPLLAAVSEDGTRIYAEAEAPLMQLGPWRTLKSGVAGQVHYHLLARPDPSEFLAEPT
jgi:16S rRNA (guanine(966)-N(2))-methyltransferase RsmD